MTPRYIAKFKKAFQNPQVIPRYFKSRINSIPFVFGFNWAFSPHTIYIIINSWCNARCLMCDIGLQNRKSQFFKIMNRGVDFNIGKFQKLISEVKSFKPEIAITSTEPLIYPHIIKAIKIIKGAGLKSILTTNGFLLPEFSKQLCNARLDVLQVSVDGPSKIHNYIRGLPNMFEKIVRDQNYDGGKRKTDYSN